MAARCRSKSGRAVDGDDGRTASTGEGDSLSADRSKSVFRPRGIKRMISARDSSESYLIS